MLHMHAQSWLLMNATYERNIHVNLESVRNPSSVARALNYSEFLRRVPLYSNTSELNINYEFIAHDSKTGKHHLHHLQLSCSACHSWAHSILMHVFCPKSPNIMALANRPMHGPADSKTNPKPYIDSSRMLLHNSVSCQHGIMIRAAKT